MKPTTWIKGITFNLACCVGAMAMCILTMVAYRFMHFAGWLFLAASLPLAWYLLRPFQFRLHEARVRPKSRAAI